MAHFLIAQTNAPQLPAALAPRAAELASKSLSPNTLRSYAAFLRIWDGFHGCTPVASAVLSAQCAGRISAASVCDFLAYLHDARSMGRSSLRTATAALKLVAAEFHPTSDLLTVAGNRRVLAVTRGILSERAAAGLINASVGSAPVMADQVRSMALACSSDDLAGLRDRALLLLGFAGAFRRSELVGLQLAHIQQHSAGLVVALPASKANQGGEREESKLILRGSVPATCPVRALQRWLDASGIRSGYVFRRLHRGQKIGKPLSGQSVRLIVKARAAAVGMVADDLSAHSLRSGLVSSALDAGASAGQIQQITGHRTPAMVAVYDKRRHSADKHAARGLL